MAKEGGAKEAEKAQKKDGAAKKDAKAKGKEALKNGATPQSRLSKLRPRRNLIFFPLFVLSCVWVVIFSDPCKVKKREDCGWAGISSTMCYAGACMLIDGYSETVVEVERPEGQKLGLKTKLNAKLGASQVQAIQDGVIQQHNKKLPAGSLMKVEVGDVLAKVNGEKSKASIDKLLANSSLPSLTITLLRSKAKNNPVKLPEWVPRRKLLESALMSKGMDRALSSFYRIGGVGVMCWLLSGYPLASLPLLYVTPSLLTTWYLTGCCYNERTERTGDPHCYQNRGDDLQEVMVKVWRESTLANIKKLLKL